MKSETMYLPLIDAPPADPSTMMMAHFEAMQRTEQTCQPYIVITCSQQLYKILVDIKWVKATKIANVILRIGEMHFLVSFINSIGKLTTNSGLEDIISSAFGAVEKMIS